MKSEKDATAGTNLSTRVIYFQVCFIAAAELMPPATLASCCSFASPGEVGGGAHLAGPRSENPPPDLEVLVYAHGPPTTANLIRVAGARHDAGSRLAVDVEGVVGITLCGVAPALLAVLTEKRGRRTIKEPGSERGGQAGYACLLRVLRGRRRGYSLERHGLRTIVPVVLSPARFGR